MTRRKSKYQLSITILALFILMMSFSFSLTPQIITKAVSGNLILDQSSTRLVSQESSNLLREKRSFTSEPQSDSKSNYNSLLSNSEEWIVERTESKLVQPALTGLSFGTPHAPIVITSNEDFDTQGWPGEGTVEHPYLISGLDINSTATGGAAINITDTDVHFFIMDCWLTSNETDVIVLDSVTHGRIKNNTILNSERGIVALHGSDLTIYNNEFYDFWWAGVYMEDCTLSTLRYNNCTLCFIGLHVEQSDNIFIEDNYCYGSHSGIELYNRCEDVTVFNNTAFTNEVGIALYLDCTNNIIDSNNCTNSMYAGVISQSCQDNEIVNNYFRINFADVRLEDCTSHTISNNECYFAVSSGENAPGAISLDNSNNSIITANYVENTFICIDLRGWSSFNEISNNNGSVYGGGVVLWFDAHHNTVTDNTLNSNGLGEVDIFIQDCTHNTVTNNLCNGSMYNILSHYSNHSQVVDNDCYSSTVASIGFSMGSYPYAEGNTLADGETGIVLEHVLFGSILDNTITNFVGFYTGGLTGIHLKYAYNVTVEGNSITECNAAIYMEQSANNSIIDNTCIDNYDGIILDNNYNITVDDNFLHLHEGYAIAIIETINCWVNRNTATNTSGSDGVCLLIGDSRADVSYNSFSHSDIGIDVVGNEGIITHNIIEDNTIIGIHIDGITGSNVTWNVFKNNGLNAADFTPSSMFDYNYWSDYIGPDSNGDGIGDTWYLIFGSANNNDTHPLVYNPTLPTWVEEPTDQDFEYGQSFSYSLSTTGPSELAPITDWWISDTTHFEINDGTITNYGNPLEFRVYPLEVHAINIYGFELSATFTVTAVDTIDPTIVGPDDFSMALGETGIIVNWTISDAGPDTFSIWIDGLSRSNGAWEPHMTFVGIHLDSLNLEVGEHTIELIITDIGGNTASDTVIVTVTAPVSTDMTILIIALGAGGAIVAVIIIIYLVKKK